MGSDNSFCPSTRGYCNSPFPCQQSGTSQPCFSMKTQLGKGQVQRAESTVERYHAGGRWAPAADSKGGGLMGRVYLPINPKRSKREKPLGDVAQDGQRNCFVLMSCLFCTGINKRCPVGRT